MHSPWVQAARPATLWAALAPVLVAGGLASGDGVFRWDAFIAAALGAIAIQIATNFANDASDAKRGADTEDRIGPTRMVATGVITERQMWTATALTFGVAALAGIWLITIAGWIIAIIGVASILAGLGYVGGPRPYGYRGLGELFVFVFFGVVATVGSRFVHDQTFPLDAWLLAIPMGFLVTAILVANNIRDLETDRSVGKRTLAVILGRPKTEQLYAGLIYGAFIAITVFGTLRLTPLATLIAVFWLPWGVGLVRTIYNETSGAALIGALKATARLQLLVAFSLALGASA
ncbi:MAG: 1,4-dihydroxy-2-naphthoate polyprenyltransferase [Acidimicrobiia bacterium]|nr:1,4-dihydroxy-2-naphthoate polyprenyltransferase [Acidimicrobiia bacterium]MDH5502399.1 1,4-dihydroxy-2-naphthoate polyprenyltransferase [Acidimicrobiia bacterium]